MAIGKVIASGHYGQVSEVIGEFLDDNIRSPLVCKQIMNTARSDMFETECAIAHSLSAFASGKRPQTHHVLRTVLKPESPHLLYMERAAGTVFELFEPNAFAQHYQRPIHTRDWFGLVFQMCHLLSFLQAQCEFQHNDMHVQNVFVVNISEPEVYNYRVEGARLSYTHRDYIIKLGDYSMAETAQHKNPYVQTERFQRYGIAKEYHPGYDWLVFLLSIYEKRRYFQLPERFYSWLKVALTACTIHWRKIVEYATEYKLAFTRPNLNDMLFVSVTPKDFLNAKNRFAIPFNQLLARIYTN